MKRKEEKKSRGKNTSFLFSNAKHETMEALENINTEISYKPQSVQHSDTQEPKFQINTQYRVHGYNGRVGLTLTLFLISEMEFASKREEGRMPILQDLPGSAERFVKLLSVLSSGGD